QAEDKLSDPTGSAVGLISRGQNGTNRHRTKEEWHMSTYPVTFPIDFNTIRATIANEIQKVTKLVAVLEEPEGPNSPRPKLPYMSLKLTSPSIKSGDDSKQNILDDE